MLQVIIACSGIVCLSTNRYERRNGTLTLRQYAQNDKRASYIEWEPIDSDTVWKTNVDDLKRILIKKRRCLLLLHRHSKWNSEYFFSNGNACAFVRMLEVTHCVKYKRNPNPFVMHFIIVEKREMFRDFSDSKIEHILDANQIERQRKEEILPSHNVHFNHSPMELDSSMRHNRKLKRKNDGFFTRIFRCGKLIFTKTSPFVWPIVKTIGKMTIKIVAYMTKTTVEHSLSVVKICGIGITKKICSVLIDSNLTMLSSLLAGACRTVEYFCNDSYDGINQARTLRYFIQ